MNLRRVELPDLRFVEEERLSLETLVEYFADNYYRLLYVVRDGCLIDVLSAHDIQDYENGERRDLAENGHVWIVDEMPSNAVIQQRFETQDTPDRLALIVDGHVACEIENVAGLNESRGLYKSQMALRIAPLFERRLKLWTSRIGCKKALVIASRDLWDIIRTRLTWLELLFVDRVSLDDSATGVDVVFDFKYFSLRKFLGIKTFTVSIFDMLEEMAVDELVERCSAAGVRLFLCRIPMDGAVEKLCPLERTQAAKHTMLRDLIHDNEYMYSYCPTESEYSYLTSNAYCDSALIDDGGLTVQENVEGNWLNVNNGIRKTIPEVDFADVECHMFGTCTMFGLCTPDNLTIPSLLQSKLTLAGKSWKVVNHACLQGRFLLNTLVRALTTPLRGGDSVVVLDFFSEKLMASHRMVFDTDRWFNEIKTAKDHWFLDYPMHCNSKANEMLSCKIYDQVINAGTLSMSNAIPSTSRVPLCALPPVDVQSLKVTNAAMYQHMRSLHKYRETCDRNNGLVILYASPFTLGHRYLVEQALARSNKVFVFVISEWFHGYSTLDRLDMVRKGLSDIDRVVVLPSEIYFASKQYFPAYGNRQGGVKDLSRLRYQEEMVAKCLCPELRITKRFLGEERADNVTNLYNRVVIQVCAESGIDSIVIPRAAVGGKDISAKLFRESVSAGRFSEACMYAPASTVQHIMNHCNC